MIRPMNTKQDRLEIALELTRYHINNTVLNKLSDWLSLEGIDSLMNRIMIEINIEITTERSRRLEASRILQKNSDIVCPQCLQLIRHYEFLKKRQICKDCFNKMEWSKWISA